MNNELTIYSPEKGKFNLVEVRHDRVGYPRVESVEPEDAVHFLTLIVGRAATLRGVTMPEPMMRFTASAVLDYIMQDERFHDISFAEVDYAFRRGVYGAYGEMYGVNASSLIRCLESWVSSEEVMDAVAVARRERRKEKQAQIDMEQAGKVDGMVGALAKRLTSHRGSTR